MDRAQEMKVRVPLERSIFLLHPCNATLVTRRGEDGRTNVMAMWWIVPVSEKVPFLAASIRPERRSCDVIVETRDFIVDRSLRQEVRG